MRTKALTALALAGMLVLAGCSGGVGNGSPTATDGAPTTSNGTPTTGTSSVVITEAAQPGVSFYVSDQQNAIEDFAHLNVTISEIGFQQAEGGWAEFDVDNRTVDLTRLQGANATRLTTVQPENGTYTKVFAHVSDVNATLTTGEHVRVKLPSEKLQLNSEFTVGANESTDFVFDIAVHKAGNSGKYILRPVVSQSGTDVPIDPVDDELAVELEDDDAVTRGGNATLAVTRDDEPVANATVEIGGDVVGTTDADGRVTVQFPDEKKFRLVVTAGDDVADLRVMFESEDGESEVEAEENDEDEREEDEDESERDDDETETDAEEDERDEDDDANETETDGDDGADDEAESTLNATFVGEVAPGGNATISVTANGSAVANATVTVDGEVVGTTDADGRVTVAVPADAEAFEVEITAGEREAELEAEF